MQNIIFFDIDGTIVTEDKDMIIPESTVEAIKLAQKKGNLTFINSGRPAFNISPRIREMGFDGYICGCGTYIEYKGEELFYASLDTDFCREIALKLRDSNVTPVYERKDRYYFDDKAVSTPELEEFKEIFISEGIRTDGLVEDDDFSFDKLVLWTNENSDTAMFRKALEKDFDIIDRGNGFFENVPKKYSKSTGIQYILDKLNIPRDNAYAIGDSTNDLPMLRAVPNSIAMGGAEKLYPYVSYITTPILENGIYNALDHFDLI